MCKKTWRVSHQSSATIPDDFVRRKCFFHGFLIVLGTFFLLVFFHGRDNIRDGVRILVLYGSSMCGSVRRIGDALDLLSRLTGEVGSVLFLSPAQLFSISPCLFRSIPDHSASDPSNINQNHGWSHSEPSPHESSFAEVVASFRPLPSISNFFSRARQYSGWGAHLSAVRFVDVWQRSTNRRCLGSVEPVDWRGWQRPLPVAGSTFFHFATPHHRIS
ncbi:unnamed protein product [Tuwongella immobilis]|uniref:Uncharacterized protein n=1 Tax=Tuwongella immobilis TaxID=692036 RepID=A0A6C2YL52_9BACT|nr:unnamed protein product [Tuwongella immobilis]VTR99964.1 unnamed protein product [Tuwongella immobilis]